MSCILTVGPSMITSHFLYVQAAVVGERQTTHSKNIHLAEANTGMRYFLMDVKYGRPPSGTVTSMNNNIGYSIVNPAANPKSRCGSGHGDLGTILSMVEGVLLRGTMFTGVETQIFWAQPTTDIRCIQGLGQR